MSLEKFSSFVHEREQEYQNAVLQKAKKLKLEDITCEIDKIFDPRDIMRDFHYGNSFEFGLMGYFFTVKLETDNLQIKRDFKITQFTGDAVKKYYEKLASEIKKAQDDYEPPF